ncbi:protein of unknown function [Shinella sp. WSC3-e]|nr:hypothetical protein SHINE37_44113 [Rhizobiaceae bacterium]CAK7258625.1 protein of unknown function [Shinella sp. WSC3-e]
MSLQMSLLLVDKKYISVLRR